MHGDGADRGRDANGRDVVTVCCCMSDCVVVVDGHGIVKTTWTMKRHAMAIADGTGSIRGRVWMWTTVWRRPL